MSEHVLIIDDDLRFRTSMQLLLQQYDYLAETAGNGRQAIELLDKNRYTAVFLDLSLPDLTGMDIAEYILHKDRDCAVIILTGQGTVSSAVKALKLGCCDYLTKPCQPQRMLQILEKAIEIRQLKLQLMASMNKYQLLADATWEGIAVLDGQQIVESNSQFQKLFKVSPSESKNYSLTDFLPGTDFTTTGGDDFGAPPFESCETEGVRLDGSLFPAEVRCKKIAGEETACRVIAVRDLTERQQAERARIMLEEQLRYSRRMESIGLMAGKVAHDLNNILSSIVTFPELLLLDIPNNTKYREDISRIKKAGKQAAAVVGDLLTIARGSTCKKEIRNLNALLEEYCESLEFINLSMSSKNIGITMELDPALANSRISPTHVINCTTNLIRNGIEAIDDGGTVVIATANRKLTTTYHGYEDIPPGDYVVLSVTDSGKGIAPNHLPNVFEPFYSKKEMGQSGTGLGLTVIMHTIRDHNGYIHIDSDENGTCFELYFPVISRLPQEKHPGVSLDTILGKGEKILIIDDEENQRLLATSILKRLGYVPYEAETGEQAIAMVKAMPVDLVILDMILDSNMNGYETYRQILKFAPGQRAIVTTGHHNHPDLRKIRELGVTHYLNKPLSLTSFAQAVQDTLNAPPR